MTPRILLHLEGGAAFIASLVAYKHYLGSWGLFAILFLAPDLSMLGYLANTRIGAACYNAIHTYLGPAILAAYALSTSRENLFLLALIWFAHIGFDRLLGYGLKYPTYFKDTHLSPARHMLA